MNPEGEWGGGIETDTEYLSGICNSIRFRERDSMVIEVKSQGETVKHQKESRLKQI